MSYLLIGCKIRLELLAIGGVPCMVYASEQVDAGRKQSMHGVQHRPVPWVHGRVRKSRAKQGLLIQDISLSFSLKWHLPVLCMYGLQFYFPYRAQPRPNLETGLVSAIPDGTSGSHLCCWARLSESRVNQALTRGVPLALPASCRSRTQSGDVVGSGPTSYDSGTRAFVGLPYCPVHPCEDWSVPRATSQLALPPNWFV